MPLLQTINTPFIDAAGAYSQECLSWSQTPSSVSVSSLRTLSLDQDTPIPESDFALMVPLSLEGEPTRDGWLVRSGFLDEESYGEDLEAALRDFLTSLCDRLQSLSRRESTLAAPERVVLDRLRAILRPTSPPTPNL